MTDLTDQLKLGKLEDGFYYIGNGEITTIAMLKNKDRSFYTWDSCIAKTLSDASEVLAPVPSFKELQSLEADRLAKNEGAEIVAELKDKYDEIMLNIRMLIQEKNLLKKHIGELGAENSIIRVLLKEVKEFIEEENPKDYTIMSERMDELLTKINEVLK